MKKSGLLQKCAECKIKMQLFWEEKCRRIFYATRQTYQQYMTDMIMLVLNDPQIMGKDVFGYDRIKKVMDAVGDKYDSYYEAMTLNPEADYLRSKLDDAIRRIFKQGKVEDKFLPFEKRYEWLPEVTYGLEKK